MANIYQGFQAGGYPNEFFPGDVSGNMNYIRGWQASANGLGFGDPCKWGGSGVEPLTSTTDSIFGFVVATRNRQISTANGGITDRYTYTSGDVVNVIYDGVVNLRCHSDIGVATPTLFVIATELTAGDGTVGQLTTSNSGDYQGHVISVRGIVSPLTAGMAGQALTCKVNTNLG